MAIEITTLIVLIVYCWLNKTTLAVKHKTKPMNELFCCYLFSLSVNVFYLIRSHPEECIDKIQDVFKRFYGLIFNPISLFIVKRVCSSDSKP